MADTLQQLLRERAGQDTIAVKYGETTRTWREYVAEAQAQAAALIGRADPLRPLHVGTLLGNTPDMLTALAAAALGGYVLCGINNTRRGAALARDIARVECQIVLVDDEHRDLLDGLSLPGVTVIDVTATEWPHQDLIPHREVGPDDTFMMIFTSGTSGEPKAVEVAHSIVLFSAVALVQRYGLTDKDTCYLAIRCSTPTASTPAGASHSLPARRWHPRSSPRRGSSRTSAATARPT